MKILATSTLPLLCLLAQLPLSRAWSQIFTNNRCTKDVGSHLLAAAAASNPHADDHDDNSQSIVQSFDAAVRNRYACKAFQRADGTARQQQTASASDPKVVQIARECLELARLSPSAFNTQPYKIVLVHSQEQKLALSKYCLGPNEQRVLDSDCTAVFVADRQILKTIRRYAQFSQASDPQNRPLQKIVLLYLAVFSSGYPVPRFLASVLAFLSRTAVGFVDWFMRKVLRRCAFPSLSSAETWSCKQATMVAMTYMLACSSRGLATVPMEGINASGVRKVLRIPQSRYAIPLIVSTGIASQERATPSAIRRYPTGQVVFEDRFVRVD